jgi:hypothetical protein
MKMSSILLRPTTILLVIGVTYTLARAPDGIRLNMLALTGFTALGAGELIAVFIQLLSREPLRAMIPGILLSGGGLVGSASIHFGSFTGTSTVLFTAAMLLLIAGVMAARRNFGDATPT